MLERSLVLDLVLLMVFVRSLALDLVLLIFVSASAEPERLVIVAGANAGVARNTAVRSGIRNLRDMIFLPKGGLYIGPDPAL